MPRKPDFERNGLIVMMREQGVSPAAIAACLRLSKGAVLGVLFRAGMTDPTAPQAAGRGRRQARAA